MKNRKRIILLDVLRVLFAIFVFMRHSATMGGCRYPYLPTSFLVNSNNMMMSMFFAISGFSLYYVYYKKDMNDIKNCLVFYKKRIISIFPIYFLVMALHFVFLEHDVILNLKLFPLEILGLQSFFDGFFEFLHNGTTWFISCILLSYFLYPYIQQLINYLDLKKRKVILVVLLILLTYLGFVNQWFEVNFYTNPLFRLLEFFLGIVLCSIINFRENNTCKKRFLFLFILLLVLGFGMVYSDITILNNLLKYIVMVVIIYLSTLYIPNKKYRILSFLAELCYAFYILQDLIWSKNPELIKYSLNITNNYLKIMFFFSILFIMSILVTIFYQKIVSKVLKNKFNIS